MVKNLPCYSGDVGLILGQGTKIPHAMGQLERLHVTKEPNAQQLEKAHVPKQIPSAVWLHLDYLCVSHSVVSNLLQPMD